MRGDLLIDDKPFDQLAPGGKHTTATWKQVVFHQPYNAAVGAPRLREWREWREVILPLFSKPGAPAARYPLRYDATGPAAPAAMSPKSTRRRLRDSAQYQQGCLLGGTDVGEEPLSPEVSLQAPCLSLLPSRSRSPSVRVRVHLPGSRCDRRHVLSAGPERPRAAPARDAVDAPDRQDHRGGE